MKTVWILSICLAMAALACRTTEIETVGPPAEVAEAIDEPIPEGTVLAVQLSQPLSAQNEIGDTFVAMLIEEVTTPAGDLLIPTGATVYGTITGVARASEGLDHGALRMNFERIESGQATYLISTEIVDADVESWQTDVPAVGNETPMGAAAEDAMGPGVGTIILLGGDPSTPTLPAGTILTLETTEEIAMR